MSTSAHDTFDSWWTSAGAAMLPCEARLLSEAAWIDGRLGRESPVLGDAEVARLGLELAKQVAAWATSCDDSAEILDGIVRQARRVLDAAAHAELERRARSGLSDVTREARQQVEESQR